jgi:hypothetical protein
MTIHSFSYKYTTETEPFTFDFTAALLGGETITSASCTVITVDGTDPNPSLILAGAPYTTDNKVTQTVTNGVSEVTYRLIATITTSKGNTYTATGDVPVYDPSIVQ